jgi:hypothetical protein
LSVAGPTRPALPHDDPPLHPALLVPRDQANP